MKQYCRYCSHLCTGNGTWCEKKQKCVSDKSAKTINHCKQFLYCELDAYNITHKYKEREKKEIIKQFSLFEE